MRDRARSEKGRPSRSGPGAFFLRPAMASRVRGDGSGRALSSCSWPSPSMSLMPVRTVGHAIIPAMGLRVAVLGAGGRMGATVCDTVEQASDLELVARIDGPSGLD